MRAIRALHDAGLQVPQDISVLGFDNDPADEFTIPSLTTIMLPVEEMAYTAIKQALQLIDKQEISPIVLFSGNLIVRESVDHL
ncbi:substrate-binding domain-containing protein [Photobacterium profundum]|uniref:Transcriptional regulator LacI/GalR-like sensor domain-containing protein n=1 Tax=Photobacterium profundum (strain SS9) TaxID=298386 RepID=Q6LU42_PHOPR|nr:substrate-binding domain-containing protein [Photobacterium profundum]CAG19183.1 hypothetical protein PBPRA0770 [Photobacterium profundum SS9]